MIIIKGKIKTSEVKFCRYNAAEKTMEVEFNNGKKYPYAYENVEWLKEPKMLNPTMYHISRNGRELFDIEGIYVFSGASGCYYHICFCNGSMRDYPGRELTVSESCLKQKHAASVFEYIKQIAGLSQLRNEKTGEKILAKRFEKITYVGNDTALANYLNPAMRAPNKQRQEYIPIFPFGCNNSQYKAVKNAMENQISVIQGPPGTGKTQTILNIIANIIMQGKTVQIVSNNNSATENVYDKLSSEKYNLGFIVATLGKYHNKIEFLKRQDEYYPDFSQWELKEDRHILQEQIHKSSIQLKEFFDRKEELAKLRQEQSQLMTELEYFNQYVEESNVNVETLKYRGNRTAKCWMELWQECQMISEEKKKLGLLFGIKGFLLYGIYSFDFYKQDIAKIITTFQVMYYRTREANLTARIAEIESYLQNVDNNLLENLCSQSMKLLKGRLAERYGGRGKRTLFEEKDLWKNPYCVLDEYPVILSTTFSSTNNLKASVVYDYIIMDEASQVDVATGALALSCAKNAVIVGDTKQLPNVVTDDEKLKAQEIFESFDINDGYQFTKSFLQSVLEVMPDVSQILLREHYRCHPKIINFCNQKFYRGELVIMTEDKGEEDVLAVVKTVPGNHARNHYSQRQIDVIKNEIIPKYIADVNETGIITPYRNQVEALKNEFEEINADTVHKFQGKEKDTIIISTVDDEITDFADDPYLINVAVSRAKKKLLLVVTGNKQVQERNITDLIDYIQYHNFEVTDSRVYSVFDYLYRHYTEERQAYLQNHKRISKYDSENLMYALIEDLLSLDKYACLNAVCHFPMNLLIKNPVLLNERECQYVMNPATHIDFLVYNRISKKVILAIEVDGYNYHKSTTVQASRDLMKDHILELYEIPLLRFKTNGSGEKEKLEETLDTILVHSL